MELAHGLLLNEEALKIIPENKKDIFIYEWLRFLHKVLKASQKSDIKEKQSKLVGQLNERIVIGAGPPTRALIGQCLSLLFNVGDGFTIYDTVTKCNDIVKNKDDSPSYLATRLTAIVCIGVLYENNGRMLGGLFPDTVQVLMRGLKNAESQTRAETMRATSALLRGLGPSAAMSHRDVFKNAKLLLNDRSMFVRSAAAQCLCELSKDCGLMFTSEFDLLVQSSVRALDQTSYDTRCSIVRLLGSLLANSQKKLPLVPKGKKPSLDEALSSILNAFINAGSTGGARDLLKGNPGSSVRVARVGLAEGLVEMVRTLGSDWLADNLTFFVEKVTEVLLHPKATATHVEAVISRCCVSFVLRSTLGGLLGEAQQQVAVAELCRVVSKQTAIVDTALVDGNNANGSSNADILQSQHLLVVLLQQVATLVRSLTTTALPLVAEQQSSLVESVLGVLIHPSQSARLAAAWCLRCVTIALPSLLCPVMDRCTHKLESLRGSGEALSGYGAALAALVGAVRESPMGIPHAKAKAVFGIAEEILRSASANSRMTLYRTQAGWLLLGAVMTLGPPTVKELLPKMLSLWKNSFPRSMRDLEQEKVKGDGFTWQVTLESRSGALCAMRSFVAHCTELLSEEVTRKLMVPLEGALALMGTIPGIVSMHGPHLKASSAMLRLRLYDILALLPPSAYEGSFNVLLRELVAEFTLTDNPAHTTTSLLRSLCNHDDRVLLSSALKESDQSFIEGQLEGQSSSGSYALEHDPTSVYLQPIRENVGSLPLGVSVIDAAIALFGLTFPHVASKHRLQMLKHFLECGKTLKNQQRHRAVQVNVFTALICALKGLGESRRNLGNEEIRGTATELIVAALSSTEVSLRCAAGEAIGRMAQVTNDTTFVSKTAQLCFEKLKTARDVISRTGHSLALGCLHRYVGVLGSGQHLRMSVGILLALSQDSNSPEVQVWSLHALSLIVDAFGPSFRAFVDPTLHVLQTLFLQVAPHQVQVHRCLGRCLGALITTMGPELQVTTAPISAARSSCLTSCAIMSHLSDPQVQAESVSCLQQLHMFAPRHVELTSLVPRLCKYLSSWDLVLRRASVSCLRQLVQKEAAEVSQIAAKCANDNCDITRGVVVTETGIEGALFALLDREVDSRLLGDTRDSVSHLCNNLALGNLRFWLSLCKSVLAASSDSASSVDQEQLETNEDENDSEIFTKKKENHAKNVIFPRWATRVFAVELVRRIVAQCRQSGTGHFELAEARRIARAPGNPRDFLVLHLSDLVRMSFMAATDNNSRLRMAGLEALQDVIRHFKDVPEPEFHGSVILEQYQANVGAALRPAFNSPCSLEVSVRACEVCSAWMSSGVVSDLHDLKRVHALLVSSLDKVGGNPSSKNGWSESSATLEKLATLKAWAEVYAAAMEGAEDNLLGLVTPHLPLLAGYWLALVTDRAVLTLPAEIYDNLDAAGGNFFTSESYSSVKEHYSYAWPHVINALALYLARVEFCGEIEDKAECEKKVHIVMGVCVEALCSPRVTESVDVIISCLSSIDVLLEAKIAKEMVGKEKMMGVEVLNVVHRLLLMRENCESQNIVLSVVGRILEAVEEFGDEREGSEEGEFQAGKSPVFAILEICVCVLVRRIPRINPKFRGSVGARQESLNAEKVGLVTAATKLLERLPRLCSPRGVLTILPSTLFLLVGTLRESMSRLDEQANHKPLYAATTKSVLQSLGSILAAAPSGEFAPQWSKLLQSALYSVLEFNKRDDVDQSQLVACLALFLLSGPPGVCSNVKLLQEILKVFQLAFTQGDSQLRSECATSLPPIFGSEHLSISRPFIHRMAPLVVEQLMRDIGDVTSQSPVTLQCIRALEVLVEVAEVSQRNKLIESIVPILISCLKTGDSPPTTLHDAALQRLIQIGPKYPVPFKSVLQSDTFYKHTLEVALTRAKTRQQEQQRASDQNEVTSSKRAQAHPTIALKMDFSNFSKK